MTNIALLKDAIDHSGIKKKKIAEVLDISYGGLLSLINGRTEFRASQIMAICALLNLDTEQRDAIFFAPGVALKATAQN